MKYHSRNGRLECDLPESLCNRLNSYALAASAAGVGILALAQAADARVVYTKAHKHIGPHQMLLLDLNHDGKPDFKFVDTTSCGTDICFTWLSVAQFAPGNDVVAYTGYLQFASALKQGSRIGPSRRFYSGGVMADLISGGAASGPWINVSSRYLGLKYKIRSHTHYAWARLNVKVKGRTITGALTGYAYETIPNKPIVAGRTKGPDVITLDDATLGHLARGASAIPTWRQSR